MMFRCEAEIAAGKTKLSREDRAEIRDYMAEVRVEAADEGRAARLLAKKLSGRLSAEQKKDAWEITLPDYGCRLLVKLYEED